MLGVFLVVLANLGGCTDKREWKEEVQLNDGRVIVVKQKKRCQSAYTGQNFASCIAREAWLTINLPEFSSQEIVWHEKLDPLILNIDKGRLYVVGWPPTSFEFRLYGASNPPYFGFVWDQNVWKRIPFSEIPEAIYKTNMLIEGVPPKDMKFISLKEKNSKEMNGNQEYTLEVKQIDPKYKISAY